MIEIPRIQNKKVYYFGAHIIFLKLLGLMVVSNCESPIVVVLSGSMEPAFYRGDLLFLTNYDEEEIRVGEIVVFKVSFKS